ncbi:MAG TPA: hypothetical protein VFD88_06760 [Clostridia bacterium]|nr:hypothetical protein [Clostridia bacterium]
MSQEHIELHGSSAFQLRCVDRILSELVRPALDEDSLAPLTRDALTQVGIRVGGDASRKELVEALWGRKRALLRQVNSTGDRGPLQPVA